MFRNDIHEMELGTNHVHNVLRRCRDGPLGGQVEHLRHIVLLQHRLAPVHLSLDNPQEATCQQS